MMYLVLTAMLALNVSKEVLDGYSAVNDTVESTNESYPGKRKMTLEEFEKEFTLNKIEVGPFWDKSKEAMKLSAEMVTYISNLRDELIATTEKVPLDSARKMSIRDLRKKDNYTVPTQILIGPLDNGSKGKARELKERIKTYKKRMLNLINPKNRKEIQLDLETEDKYKDAYGKVQSWERHHFYDIPLAADIPILNKFISEVNNAELEVVNGLLRESIAEDFKYDRIEAKVLPKSNYLFIGDEFEAEVIVAAYDTSHSPSPSVYLMKGVDSMSVSQKSDATQIARDKGHLVMKFPTTTLGLQKYAGFVSVPTASGKERTYHFKGEYFVSTPYVTVSPTNMNVLYAGIENPLSVSITGIPMENLTPTISPGTIRQDPKNKGWVCTVPSGAKESTVSVSIKSKEGNKLIGTQTFRIKKLPDPTPTIAGRRSGFLTKQTIFDAGKIVARMPADYEFDFNFKVQSFKLTMERGFNTYTYESPDGNLTEEMVEQIQRTNRGQILEFVEIIVLGPTNDKRELEPFSITIK